MVNAGSKPIRFIMMLLVIMNAGLTSNARATGIPVIDAANIAQSIVTATESVDQTLILIDQYKKQLEQYENMVRNTLAPPAYLWAKAQFAMNKLIHLTNTIRYYEQTYGGIDGYMQRFRNVEYYRSSPCFSVEEKCNEAAWKLLQDGQNTSTDAQKKANDGLLTGLSEHQSQMPVDAAHLQLLQQRTETAEGQMAALQYANQLAAFQANQLLQMRQMLIAQHNALNTQAQAEVDLKAMQQAARGVAIKRLSPEILPVGRSWSVRDGF
ncbi:P-type conjugative transfer protein TrbJ [Nitrosomonas sp. JL21]|uniref:P-type conjugative transfer protein TrbJ n=1 Tax=Nitrosomonas sp. JL21 TaxID=153949 RepID=UPI00136940CC|nr:P-type conjugative transfer protein TrbJ [Nitrosomonas sp. JL21]MXS77950.1 P-type conjugative transfer protein TrbJ [Nitrosomonas sp. JL21]